MTDKQIIIDGCDVSGCEFYFNGCCGINGYVDCIDTPNCVYKQLKRKEQECEELKKVNEEKNELLVKLGCPTIATARMKAFTLEQQLNQLKAENEVLEKVNKTNQEKIKKLNEQVEEEFIAQQYGDMALFWKVEDYKQALTEIKEIAKQHNAYAYCNSKVDMRKILQKCEVLDEN